MSLPRAALAALLAAAVLLVATAPVSAQKPKKGSEQTRTVEGTVTGPDDKAVSGAVVQLKNTKTLQIRSFLTREDGSYYFQGLSPDIDYELTARTDHASSGNKTLSSFDTRKDAIINLKLNEKK